MLKSRVIIISSLSFVSWSDQLISGGGDKFSLVVNTGLLVDDGIC